MLLAVVPWWSMSCEKNNADDGHEVELTFSADTVAFDTLFTTIGSTTLQVKVYNRSSRDVVLESVTLAGGSESPFRLNVDGDTSLVARNVEIMAGDSIFIFIQANVHADTVRVRPFIVEDAILFSNGQRLPVTAWGRNAVYHRLLPGDTTWYAVVDCEHWDHTRPHVILGIAAVLDGHTLRLQEGDELYFGDGAMLVFDTNARLVAKGTAEQPVLFTSLRHDGWYSFLPGQWQCIWFTGGSTGSTIDHAVVENGTGGLRAYPDAEFTVSNTVIRNMSDCALIGQGGSITGSNLLVYDCLGSLTVLQGGSYSFTGCTFADYWPYSARSQESVILANYMITNDGTVAGDLTQADFTDCIIWGSREEEVLLAGLEGFSLNYQFNHCWVKGTEGVSDPMFVDKDNGDYHLQENSPAAGIGYQYDN